MEGKNTGNDIGTTLSVEIHYKGEITKKCYSILTLKECSVPPEEAPEAITLEEFRTYTDDEIQQRAQLLYDRLCINKQVKNEPVQLNINCFGEGIIGTEKQIALNAGTESRITLIKVK